MIRTGDARVQAILANRHRRSPYRLPTREGLSFIDRFPQGCWKGQPCFIIGGGPSLRGFDFERLRGRGRVIAINKAFADVPFADIMYAMDRPLLDDIMNGKLGEDYRQAFAEFRGAKVWLDLSGYSYPEGVYVIKSAGGEGWSESLQDGLIHGQHSGYSALNLAILLGADPIYLLGYDCKPGPDKEPNYHSGYPKKAREDAGDVFLRTMEDGARKLKGGPRVVNLNPQSAFRAFPFGNVDEVAPVRQAAKGGRITAITPTGDRPLAMSLCVQWMACQTRPVDEWIIVDDGKGPMRPIPGTVHVRRDPQIDDPKMTLDLNLEAALPHITGDKIIIIEDDEYYAPGYIEAMSKRLDAHEVVGIINSRYYHLPTGGVCINPNTGHASLAQTGFRRSFLPAFEALVREGSHPRWIDDRMWAHIQARKNGQGKVDFLLFPDADAPLYVGMKGLPGRGGIGVGHKESMYRKRDDAERSTLKAWAPHGFRAYLDILAGDAMRSKHVQVDIIVPTYENEDLTVACFESIKRCTDPAKYRLIWVDNASKGTSKVERCLEGVNHIPVRMPSNVGFVGAINCGIQLSNSDYVCLLNNDTVVSPGWLDKLLDAFSLDPALGIVGPVTVTAPRELPKNYDSHHCIKFIEDQARRRLFPEFVDLDSFNREIEVTFKHVLADCAFVAFLCAVIRRDVIDKVGLLDVNFAFGMYDDNDYNLAVRNAGWKTRLLYSTCIYHRGRATFNMVQEKENLDVTALLRRNHAYLQKKWGL